VIIWYFFVSRW